jgi:hypothetical protein
MIEERKFEILIETAREYIENYPFRLEGFIFEFEGNEAEFIERDLSFFELVELYIEDREGWVYPIFEVEKALKHLDMDNIIYPLRRKIEFLVEKQKVITSRDSRTVIKPPHLTTEGFNERVLSTKEYALVYLLDLFARGETIPMNPIEGSISKKKIEKEGKDFFDLRVKPNSFYKEVKYIHEKFDLNKKSDLDHLSKRWLQVVKTYSRNWNLTETYLKSNFLIENEGENTGEL